jgi:hypothetical protein
MLYKLLILVFSFSIFTQTEDNLIDWSPTRKLTWNDFQGTPDPSSPNAALTNSNINVEFGFNNKGMTHSIRCRFNKQLSWGRIKNDYILNHEQGHFNIAEAHARLLHKRLSQYVFNSKTVDNDIKVIHSTTMKDHVAMQKQYDLITNHSLDSAEQKIWDGKISAMLEDLNAFSDYR